MSNQELIYIKGKLSWVKHIRPDTQFDPHAWKITIHPDDDSLEIIKGLKKDGLQNHLKMDDEGQYITFSRKTERKFKGRVEGMTPPVVIDKNKVPIERPIGNGSDGIIELEVYKHKTPQPNVFKKAARWSKLRVDTMIEFNAERDFPDGGASVKSLSEEPEQLF